MKIGLLSERITRGPLHQLLKTPDGTRSAGRPSFLYSAAVPSCKWRDKRCLLMLHCALMDERKPIWQLKEEDQEIRSFVNKIHAKRRQQKPEERRSLSAERSRLLQRIKLYLLKRTSDPLLRTE